MTVAPSIPATEWCPILSAPGYFASNKGEIRGRRVAILRSHLSKAGYLRVGIQSGPISLSRTIHRLVCEAFHGPPPSPQHHAAHGDGNRLNNCPENLRWATPAENCADRCIHGTDCKGERNGRARLTADQARQIKAIYASVPPGHYVRRGSRTALAKTFGVTVRSIKDVAAGRSWRDA